MKNKLYTLEDDLKKRLRNPDFKKAWEESEIEYQLSRNLIEARLLQKLSQRERAGKESADYAGNYLQN